MFVQAKQAPVDAQPSVYLVQELTNLYLGVNRPARRTIPWHGVASDVQDDYRWVARRWMDVARCVS